MVREVDAAAGVQLGRRRKGGGSLRPQQKKGQSILLSFTAFKVGPIHEGL